ncbi:Major facilitator superfamily domain-containing protein 6-B [Holothuria leucospilota]|uniref:Major facilitator superfamily domain-containing protein 6-B n=1 Tax=Holothuria leucospilota TaxID=206669 RepID=A0A9Q1C490_HOLLE|nr:Major facilitator superfamily domain-containing protein 6-B [Holothuria leucospilota]
MVDIGLNPFQVGILKCLEPVTIFTTSPIWGSIADKFNVRKGLLILCALGSALCFPLVILVPPVNLLETDEVENTSMRDMQVRNFSDVYGPSGQYLNVSENPGLVNREEWKPSIFTQASLITFTLIGILTLIDNIFVAGFLPLLDSSTMELCRRYPGTSYGGQRWLGAFAVVVFSPIAGFLFDWFENSDINLGDTYFLHSKYLPSFVLFTILMLVSVIPVCLMEVLPSKASPSISRELLVLFKDLHIVLTFVLFIVVGMCKGIVVAFLFIYLEELKASSMLMSLSLVITCLAETPCLIASGKVIEKLGYEVVFASGLFAYIVRLLGYSLLENPWMVLLIEPLHGVCYGLIWPCCTEYANHIAPEGMSSTLQSLAHAAKAGVGTIA